MYSSFSCAQLQNQKDSEVNQTLRKICVKLESKMENAAKNDGVREISESVLDGQIAVLRGRLEGEIAASHSAPRPLRAPHSHTPNVPHFLPQYSVA